MNTQSHQIFSSPSRRWRTIVGLAASALAIAAASLIGKRYGKAIEKSAGVAVRRAEGAIRTAGSERMLTAGPVMSTRP